MTVKELAGRTGLSMLCAPDEEREVAGVYCGDLLSFVMGRAPADCAWVTVMGNVNAVAVAVLADVACIVLSEGVVLDEAAAAKASEQGVYVLASPQSSFDAGLCIHEALK